MNIPQRDDDARYAPLEFRGELGIPDIAADRTGEARYQRHAPHRVTHAIGAYQPAERPRERL